jgi:exopolysaccharide production protein ExoZ
MVFRSVQALRAIAAVAVVCFHIGNRSGIELRYISPDVDVLRVFGTFGGFGVDLFFVISGFIMMVTTWEQFGMPGASPRFLLRRFVRIYPAYWLLIVPLAFLYAIRPDFVNSHSAVQPDLLASFSLLPQQGAPLLLVSWSLVYEVEFYVVFGLALCFSRRLVLPFLAAWAGWLLVAPLMLASVHGAYGEFFASQLPLEFVLGAIVGVAVRTGRVAAPLSVLIAGSAALAVALAFVASSGSQDVFDVRDHVLFVALPCAALVYGLVGLEMTRSRLAVPAVAVLLGDASYALYLWHVPVLAVLGRLVATLHLHGLLAHLVAVPVLVGATLVIAIQIYRNVERPLTRALNRRLGLSTNGGVLRAVRGPVVGVAAAEPRSGPPEPQAQAQISSCLARSTDR